MPLIVMFLLDAICSLARVRAHRPAGTGAGQVLAIAAMVALIVATGLVRAADVRGRLHEITEPYRGPLDYVIDRIGEFAEAGVEEVMFGAIPTGKIELFEQIEKEVVAAFD